MANDILNAKDFTFRPFQPSDYEGDSGALQLATSKKDASIQYVVKSGMYGLACNEFMYHKIATSLGLYTPEVKLILGLPEHKHAAAIRYIPNAQKYIHSTDNEANRRDFYAFLTLYAILNEEDSQEFYIDEQGRLLKLDNAASFNLSYLPHGLLTMGIDLGLEQMLRNSLDFIEYDKYEITLEMLTKNYGETAKQTFLEMFERFSTIDETAFEEAYNSLDRVYPSILSDYYCEYILIRKAVCERFMRENTK